MHGLTTRHILASATTRDWRLVCHKMGMLTPPMYTRFERHWHPTMTVDEVDQLTVDKGDKHARDDEDDMDFDCQSPTKKQCQVSTWPMRPRRPRDSDMDMKRTTKRMRRTTVEDRPTCDY